MDTNVKKETLKIISLVFVLILIVNLVLFGTGKITAYGFWFIIGLCALAAYIGLPKLKKL